MSVRGQRIVLMLLLAMAAFPGSWALAAPRSFYDSFPGAGMHWVSALLCVPRGRWTGTPVAGTPVAADRTGVDR
jgi:hypothetical protein